MGVLSFWCSETALIGKYFCDRFQLRHFIWILGQDARKNNKWVQWIKPNPQELIALSEFIRDEFHKNHNIKPAHIAPNGIDPERYERHTSSKHIDILGVGSLIKLKQFDQFISIVAKLQTIFPEIKALLCGKGPEEYRLRQLAKDLGVDKNIEFKGELSHRDVLALMQASKILLHPSSYEGYSTVALEALYAGCHVISLTFAERSEIKHWHIVHSEEELETKCNAILKEETDFSQVKVHLMSESTATIMKFFLSPQ